MKRLIGLVLILGFVLAACTTDSGIAPSTSSAPAVDLDEPVTTGTTVPPTVPVEPPSTTVPGPSTTPGALASAACVVGVWELDSQLFLDQLGSVYPAEFPDVGIEHTGGTFTIELDADGSVSGTRSGWTLTIGAGEGRLVYSIDAQDTGTYALDSSGGTLAVTLEPASVPQVTTQVQVDGALDTLDVGPSAFELPDAAQNPSGTFSCSGDRLRVSTPLGLVLEFSRR